MKKTLYGLLAMLVLFSCGKDDDPIAPGYPTDGLSLRQEQNFILHLKADLNSASAASLAALQRIFEEGFKPNVITTSSLSAGDPIHTSFSDTLANQLNAQSLGLFINGENAFTWDEERFEAALEQEPLLSVAHVGGQNDTAWYVDVKMKLFRDTNSNFLYVNAYLLSDFTAEKDADMDLTLPPFNGVVQTVNEQTVYDMEHYSLDSNLLISKGEVYVHRDVVMYGNPHIHSRGYNIAEEFNPFGIEFYKGDVLGTEFTPIRIYIKKPDNLDPAIEAKIKPKFLTVVWSRDLENGGWKFMNAYKGS